MRNRFWIKTINFLLVGVLVFFSFPPITSSAQTPDTGNNVYLPLVSNNYVYHFKTNQKFIGIYMQQYWYEATIGEMQKADNLAGKKHSVSAWFIDINDPDFNYPLKTDMRTHNFYRQMEILWNTGYISFVNLNSTATAYDIASGKYDSQLNIMADVYKRWIDQGGGRKAILAPLPEMNGVRENGIPWASYGGDPVNFKLAYQRFLNIFSQHGIVMDDVWWAFAPNGWSKTGHEFEKYYPGDLVVDIIGFSSYNYGFCAITENYQKWENYNTLYKPYLDRIDLMAPSKPVIISQTGTTAQYTDKNDFDINAKNQWLDKNYNFLSQQPQVVGVLYYDFNLPWECNWRVTGDGETLPDFTGYTVGASNAPFQYMDAAQLEALIP